MDSQNFDTSSGLESLFDLSFTRFITINMVKVIYILAIVAIILGWLVAVGTGFFAHGFLGGVLMMIVATVFAVLYLLWIRVGLELVVVIFRIGQNTARIADGYGSTTGGFPVQPIAPPPPGL